MGDAATNFVAALEAEPRRKHFAVSHARIQARRSSICLPELYLHGWRKSPLPPFQFLPCSECFRSGISRSPCSLLDRRGARRQSCSPRASRSVDRYDQLRLQQSRMHKSCCATNRGMRKALMDFTFAIRVTPRAYTISMLIYTSGSHSVKESAHVQWLYTKGNFCRTMNPVWPAEFSLSTMRAKRRYTDVTASRICPIARCALDTRSNHSRHKHSFSPREVSQSIRWGCNAVSRSLCLTR